MVDILPAARRCRRWRGGGSPSQNPSFLSTNSMPCLECGAVTRPVLPNRQPNVNGLCYLRPPKIHTCESATFQFCAGTATTTCSISQIHPHPWRGHQSEIMFTEKRGNPWNLASVGKPANWPESVKPATYTNGDTTRPNPNNRRLHIPEPPHKQQNSTQTIRWNLVRKSPTTPAIHPTRCFPPTKSRGQQRRHL